MGKSEKTLIIIPAHNEEKSLPKVIKALETFSPDADVLVVNDASKDKTSETARNTPSSLKIEVLDLPYNLGIGGAMQTGFKYARDNEYDVAMQIDGDGQHPAKFIKDIKNGVLKEGADMVVGGRFISKKGFKGAFLRRLGIRYFSLLIRLFTGIEVKDTTSGFRAFSSKAIKAFSEYYPHDYPEVESFVVLKKLRFTAMEKPVIMKRRQHGTSTINWIDGIHYMIRVSLGVVVSSLRNYKKLKGGIKC